MPDRRAGLAKNFGVIDQASHSLVRSLVFFSSSLYVNIFTVCCTGRPGLVTVEAPEVGLHSERDIPGGNFRFVRLSSYLCRHR